MNLQGSIDLLKLEKAGIATIKNKKCVVIPIEENDLYVSMDENLKAKAVYLGININELINIRLLVRGKADSIKDIAANFEGYAAEV